MDDPAAVDACTMTVAQMDDSPETPAVESEPAPAPAPAPAKPTGFKVSAATVPPPAAKPQPKATPKATPAPVAAQEEPTEPQVRTAPAKPSAVNVSSILEQWGEDVDD
jgi:hypothetical protein